MNAESPNQASSSTPSAVSWIGKATLNQQRKLLLFVMMVVTVAIFWSRYGDTFDLQFFAVRELELKQFQHDHPTIVLLLALLVFVAVTGLSLPGTLILMLAYGWFFGFLTGAVLANVGSTFGAIVAFLICRYLLRDSVKEKFNHLLTRFNKRLDCDGPYFLIGLRVIPFPAFVVNALLAQTNVPLRTFWWTSHIGLLPASIIYAYAASRIPTMQVLAEHGIYAAFTPRQFSELMLVLTLVGSMTILTRVLLRRQAGD